MRKFFWSIVILTTKIIGILCTIDHLELMMPRYAQRGGDAVLKCEHSVTLEQLHKVEWRKGGKKIFQYIKGRKPPFRYFQHEGITLNNTNSNEKQVHLSKLDFPASGSYTCTVSMETPIFTKDSDSKLLTIIELQDDNPKILFDKDNYEVGELLEANCTTAKSRPPPHITWFINGEKVNDKLTKSFLTSSTPGHGYFEQKGYSIKQLKIEVSDLHVRDDNTIELTCMATIPGFISNLESYADKRITKAEIDVELTEGPVEAISNSDVLAASTTHRSSIIHFLLIVLLEIFTIRTVLC